MGSAGPWLRAAAALQGWEKALLETSTCREGRSTLLGERVRRGLDLASLL